jgi:hypothetical protein
MQLENHFTQIHTRHPGSDARRQTANPVERLPRHRRKIVSLAVNFNQPSPY